MTLNVRMRLINKNILSKITSKMIETRICMKANFMKNSKSIAMSLFAPSKISNMKFLLVELTFNSHFGE